MCADVGLDKSALLALKQWGQQTALWGRMTVRALTARAGALGLAMLRSIRRGPSCTQPGLRGIERMHTG